VAKLAVGGYGVTRHSRRSLTADCLARSFLPGSSISRALRTALVNGAAASTTASAAALSWFPPPFNPPVSYRYTVPNILPPKPKRFSLPSCSPKLDLALATISLKSPPSSSTVSQSLIPSARLHLRAAFSCRSLAFSLLSLLTVSDKLPLVDCNLINSSCSTSRRADDSLMVSSFRARNAL
jgi:hypothetical protein